MQFDYSKFSDELTVIQTSLSLWIMFMAMIISTVSSTSHAIMNYLRLLHIGLNIKFKAYIFFPGILNLLVVLEFPNITKFQRIQTALQIGDYSSHLVELPFKQCVDVSPMSLLHPWVVYPVMICGSHDVFSLLNHNHNPKYLYFFFIPSSPIHYGFGISVEYVAILCDLFHHYLATNFTYILKSTTPSVP